MGAAGLVNIRRRMKSIKNTKKITKAMSLVSTSKLRKARARLYSNNNYFNAYKEIVNEVVPSLSIDNVYLKGNNSSRKLLIVITSDMGLCGSYNNNIIESVIGTIRGDKSNYDILMVGKRGKLLIKKYKYETIAEYVEIPDSPTIKEASTIFNHAAGMFLRGEVGEVDLVYTKFINQLTKKTNTIQLLPLVQEEAMNLEQTNSDFELEGNKEELLEKLLAPYFNAVVLNAMLNAKVSEQSYRMESMESATKNADELINKLNLAYNRIRQGAITQEISEIVGGAQAQK